MYLLTPITREEMGKDTRGRPIYEWVPSPTPISAKAIAPASADEVSTSVEAKYTEIYNVYVTESVSVSTLNMLQWNERNWNVVSVKDYNHGPWTPRGSVIQIAWVGESNE